MLLECYKSVTRAGLSLGYTNLKKNPIFDLCTEIVLFSSDFLLQSQHRDFDLALSLGISQKALTVKEIMGFEDGLS